MAFFSLIVVVVLLVIADRVALAVAENDFADQAVSSGMPVKPSVTIEGFPFLTQLIGRDFRKVDLSASNIPAGPVNITSVKATLTGMHLNSSFSGATVDHINVTAFVSFAALANAGGGTGISMTADGPNKVKITAGVGGLISDTEVAQISQTGPQQISVQVLNSGSPLGGLLSSFGSFSFTLPKLPATVHITSLSVTPQGLILTAAADHANLTKPSS
jgi:LmeA-like phospholipid-binding